MTRQPRTAREGDGTAWLVADRAHGDFLCYWFVGPSDQRVAEQARAASADEAVAWGRLRTTRVRIRTDDGCSYWAGSAPQPEGFRHTWQTKAEEGAGATC